MAWLYIGPTWFENTIMDFITHTIHNHGVFWDQDHHFTGNNFKMYVCKGVSHSGYYEDSSMFIKCRVRQSQWISQSISSRFYSLRILSPIPIINSLSLLIWVPFHWKLRKVKPEVSSRGRISFAKFTSCLLPQVPRIKQMTTSKGAQQLTNSRW